jgi:lycopene cyclase domain-containing protein
MLRVSYYLFNFLVVAGPASILLLRSKDISVRFRSLLAVYISVSLPFIVWDIWAARGGHWGFNPAFTIGPDILGIPLEEVLFFLTVPFAMIFVWEVVNKHFTERVLSKWLGGSAVAIALLSSVALLLMHWQKGYTRSVALALIPTMLLLTITKLVYSRRFWVFSMLHLMLFMISNSILTALPVITYGEQSFIGFRIGTIPIEDFIFSYCLINSAVICYEKLKPIRIK